MLQSLKRLTKHSAIYGIGHILTRSIGFLLLPVHTNALNPAQMGIAALLFSSLGIMNIVFGYGMDVAFLRNFIVAETEGKRRQIFSTAFLTLFGTGLIFATFLFIFPAPLSKIIFRSTTYLQLIRLGAGILLCDVLVLLPFLVLRGLEKSTRFGILKFINVIANLGFNIYFVVYLNQGVVGIFKANLLSSAISLVTVLPVIIQWLRIRYSTSMLKELLRFGLPYIPSMLSVLIMDQISRFFLDRMVGTEATGIFSAAYKLGMFMALIVAAFRFAWHPFFLTTAKQEDAHAVFSRILTYFVLITGMFHLAVSFFIDNIISFTLFGYTIIGEKYSSGIPIVPIIMLAYICYGIYVNFIVGIYINKKTHILPFITGIGAIVSLSGNYFLIPILGIPGAAWSTFFAYTAMAMSLYFYSQKLYPVKYEWGRLVKIALIFIPIFFIGTMSEGPFLIIRRIILLPMSFVFLYFIGFFTPGEKKHMRNLQRRLMGIKQPPAEL
ncbi:oligosaccharide flippase family protein [bacterium]|nr:oligosaccharide flippase family protein [bacterium]